MKIFIAKLNYKTTTEALQQLFEGFGEVNYAKVVEDKETGRSKGFGFVEMLDDKEAMSAIKGLDGTQFDGRTIVVQKSVEKPKS